jgi:hypothetical protein
MGLSSEESFAKFTGDKPQAPHLRSFAFKEPLLETVYFFAADACESPP